MAGFNPSMAQPTLTSYPASEGGGPAHNAAILSSVQAHHGLIGMVLIAVAVLFLLDRIGFKFVFTAGKR